MASSKLSNISFLDKLNESIAPLLISGSIPLLSTLLKSTLAQKSNKFSKGLPSLSEIIFSIADLPNPLMAPKPYKISLSP